MSAGPVSALRLAASRSTLTITEASSDSFDCAVPTPSSTEARSAANRSCCSTICAPALMIRSPASTAASRIQLISGLIAPALAARRSAPPCASPSMVPTPSRISPASRFMLARKPSVRSASDPSVSSWVFASVARASSSDRARVNELRKWFARTSPFAASSAKRSSISAKPRSISAIMRCEDRSCSATRFDRLSIEVFARSILVARLSAACVPALPSPADACSTSAATAAACASMPERISSRPVDARSSNVSSDPENAV